jgi:hypothetical protein
MRIKFILLASVVAFATYGFSASAADEEKITPRHIKVSLPHRSVLILVDQNTTSKDLFQKALSKLNLDPSGITGIMGTNKHILSGNQDEIPSNLFNEHIKHNEDTQVLSIPGLGDTLSLILRRRPDKI